MGKDKGKKDKHRGFSAPAGRATEAELRALAESVPTALLIADATGAALFASPAFDRMAEAALAPRTGLGWLEVLAPADRAIARELWISAAEARQPREAELSLAGGRGQVVWRVAPVVDDGRVLRWVMSFADISEPEAPEGATDTSGRLHLLSGQIEDEVRARGEAEERRAEAEAIAREAERARDAEAEAARAARAALAEEESRSAALRDHLSLAQAERAASQSLLAEAEQRAARMAERLGEAEARGEELAAEAARLAAGLAAAERLGEEAQAQLFDQSSQIVELGRALAEAGARLAEGAARGEEAERALAEAAERLAAEVRLREEAEAARAEADRVLGETRGRLGAEEARRGEIESQLAQSESAGAALRAELEAVQVHLGAEESRRQQAEARLLEAEVARAGLEAERQALAMRLEEAEGRIAAAEEALAREGALRAGAEARLAEAIAQRQDLAARLEEAELRLEEAEAGLARSGEERASLEWRLTDAETRRGDLAAQLAEAGGQIADLAARLEAAERAVPLAAEARLRAALDALPQPAWTAGPDGAVAALNRGWHDFTGTEEGAAPDEAWLEAIHPEDRPRVAERWQASVAAGTGFEAELRLRHHDGTWRWALCRARPEPGPEGVAQGWIGSAADIHDMVRARRALADGRAELEREREQLEEQLEARAAALEEAEARLGSRSEAPAGEDGSDLRSRVAEAVGRLADGLAHDMNSVLSALAAAFGVIERRTLEPRLAEVARHGVAATGRGTALVRRLLAFAGRQPLAPRPLGLPALLEAARPALDRALGERRALRLETAPGLPPVQADPEALEAALLELLHAARLAWPEGAAFALSARPAQEGRVALSLSLDAGPEPAPATPALATASGLALVEAFARQSGGDFHLEEEPGRGPVVTLVLPAAAVPERAPAALRAAAILLVEEDVPLRTVTAAQLRAGGHQVTAPGDVEAALRALEDGTFDLLLAGLSGPDGLALATEAQARRPGLPILLLTDGPTPDAPGTATRLARPLSPAALLRAVEAALAGATAPRPEDARQDGAAGEEPPPEDEAAPEPPAPQGPEAGDPELDRLAARLRSAELRELLAQWRDARGSRIAPPLDDGWDDRLPSTAVRVVLAEIGPEGEPQALRVAREGESGPLAQALAAQRGPGGGWGPLAEAGRPAADFAELALGPAQRESLERLVLPFSTDGRRIDRLAAFVVSGTGTSSGNGGPSDPGPSALAS